IALGEVELVHVSQNALVLAEMHEALEVIRIVDVRMIWIRADEAVACRNRRRLLVGAPVRERGLEDRLLRVAAIGKARLELIEELGRPRIIAPDHRFVRGLVESIRRPGGGLVLYFG